MCVFVIETGSCINSKWKTDYYINWGRDSHEIRVTFVNEIQPNFAWIAKANGK